MGLCEQAARGEALTTAEEVKPSLLEAKIVPHTVLPRVAAVG
jgi:hypothetical protein